MKIIPKAQYGTQFIAQPDNTRVAKPVLVERMEYKPKPDELFITDKRTGKKVLVKRRNETVSPDNRSNYQRQQSQKQSQNIYRKHQEDKKIKEGMKNLQGLLTLVTPSTYVGPVFNNNGKSYIQNVMSGQGSGDVAGNVAIDMLTPFAVGGAKSLATRLFPKSITVYKGGVKPFTRDYTFFTTDKEYAKQFGPVQKYKLKYRHPGYTKDPLIYKDMEWIHFNIDNNLRQQNKHYSDIIIGHDALTSEGLIPSKGTEYVVWNPKQIRATPKKKVVDMFIPFAVGAKSLASGIVKYPQNVGRRVVETAMRTTPYANPIPEISNNFHIMLHGNNGGKGRLLHIGNYILTGKRVGPKGYYNSFAPFTQLNDIIVTKPSLGSRMKAFTQPEGTSFAFSGYVDRLGQVPPYTGGNDIIDAFLYQKTIDPKYGVRRINSDYGIHTDYVNKWYPNKKVQVYEVQNSSGIPEVEVTDKSSWLPSTEFSKDFGTNYDNVLNAAGHLKQTGIYNNARVIRRQDIWKFNPTEYKQRWFENKRLYTDEPLWKKKLLDMGLRYVDRIGTPIITRTKWVYE